MNKRTRLIILLVCIACFLTGVSILVPYSMGYRFDFANMKITATGGIYVRTFPAAEKVIIDRKITEEPGLFSNSVFVQSLLPGLHAVLVQKNSYYDYSKTIPVPPWPPPPPCPPPPPPPCRKDRAHGSQKDQRRKLTELDFAVA